MSPMLATASAVISLALVAYTIGVFSERRSGELKRSHLVFFWLGLICDSTGTGLMSIMAQSPGRRRACVLIPARHTVPPAR